MTGQVKEEILTRWGELGLRVRDGRVHFDPVLLDAAELPDGGALQLHLGPRALQPIAAARRRGCACRPRPAGRPARTCSFDPAGVLAVEAEVSFKRG